MAKIGRIGTSIPANTALSGEIDLGSNNLLAFEFDANFNSTVVTFQVKSARFKDEETSPEVWQNLYDDAGNEVSLTVAKSRVVAVSTKAAMLAPCRYIRIRSGTASSPVTVPYTEIIAITKEA